MTLQRLDSDRSQYSSEEEDSEDEDEKKMRRRVSAKDSREAPRSDLRAPRDNMRDLG